MSPADSLPTTPHLQPGLLNPQDTLVPYLITEIEDYLAQDMERRQAEEEKLWSAKPRITLFKSTDDNTVRLHTYLWYKVRTHWQRWATNPYNLHPIWHIFIMVLLLLWILGSSVIAFYEVGADTTSVAIAKLCRGFLGSVPPIIQLLLFMYPPLFVQF